MIFILFFVQDNTYLINDPMLSMFTDNSFHRLSLSPMNIIILNNRLHLLKTFLNYLFIITGTILSQQIFQNISRYGQTTLDLKSQILTDHFADKGIHYLLLQTHTLKIKIVFY